MATIGTMDVECPKCKNIICVKPTNQRSGGKSTVCSRSGRHINVKFTRDGYFAKVID